MDRITQDSIQLASGHFSFLRRGHGRRLLILLHGFPDHPPTFERLMGLLAAGGYDVVAPWLRGYAPSTLEGPYDIDQIARDALALASALGHEKLTLVGHDWGAIATYVACTMAPHRVAAAVAMSIPHPWTFKRPQQLAYSAYVPLLAAPGGAELARARDFALVDLLWRRWSPSLTLDTTRRRALHACLSASWPAPARYYRALLWPPSAARFGERMRITVPLLHLHGVEDGCVAVQTGRGQERFFDGPFASEVRARAGHFLALEAPEWVAERALQWLDRFDAQRTGLAV